ncbi:hypothetical protein T05_1889 [Trichinella murrelli]|uniref:Uncharacterized protein n=1 Tax=Trichinella murrelli TaxID=144512 RepID=A0A0V0U9G7_9BILA|nr:hypothetical protein T05_1889 [Trichinella murrelli]
MVYGPLTRIGSHKECAMRNWEACKGAFHGVPVEGYHRNVLGSEESVGRGEEEERIGMLPLGLTYVPLRSHCSLIGR